jgi:hypothetical protein
MIGEIRSIGLNLRIIKTHWCIQAIKAIGS